jgi:hypothetical protein
MASWLHFTDYLDGSRPITKAERDELFSNYDAALRGCSDNYQLHGGLVAEMIANGYLHDLVPLYAFGSLASIQQLGRTITDAPVFNPSGGQRLLEAADDEGVSLDPLLEPFQRMRASQLDHYRIWNILKRAIDKLSCELPVLEFRSVQAAKSKYGYTEFGYVGPTPPRKKYLRKTYSGSMLEKGYTDPDGPCETEASCSTTNTYSGHIEIDRFTGEIVENTYNVSSTQPDCLGGGNWESEAVSPTVYVTEGQGCGGGTGAPFFYNYSSGTITETLSDEYTTEQVIIDATDALGDYSDWEPVPLGYWEVASLDIPPEELSAEVRRGKYRFALPDLSGVACYRIEWDEVFYPDDDDPVITHRTWTRGGETDYSSTYTVNPPETEGYVTVENMAVFMECS